MLTGKPALATGLEQSLLKEFVRYKNPVGERLGSSVGVDVGIAVGSTADSFLAWWLARLCLAPAWTRCSISFNMTRE